MCEIILRNKNCLDSIQEIKDKNIIFNAIITDPPYNISKENNLSTLKNKRQGVDFGKWDKDFDTCAWIENFTPFIHKDGCIIIFCSYIYMSFIIQKLALLNFIVKDILRWEKSNPMPRNINRRYVQDCEFAIWAVRKNAKWTFNKPQNVPYLRASFKTSVVSGKEKVKHSTQKSLKLMQEIIKIHTNTNDFICDPFMGSGTTGVACKILKRNFFGIEINKEYFDIAKNRIYGI